MRIDARRAPLQAFHWRVASVYDYFSPFGKKSLTGPEAWESEWTGHREDSRLSCASTLTKRRYKRSMAGTHSIRRQISLDMDELERYDPIHENELHKPRWTKSALSGRFCP